jgi:hypothetical protein
MFSDQVHPFLVAVRDPNHAPQLGGTVHILVAMTMTQKAARDTVQEIIPEGWRIEAVLGVAEPTLVIRRGLKPGTVEELSGGMDWRLRITATQA